MLASTILDRTQAFYLEIIGSKSKGVRYLDARMENGWLSINSKLNIFTPKRRKGEYKEVIRGIYFKAITEYKSYHNILC